MRSVDLPGECGYYMHKLTEGRRLTDTLAKGADNAHLTSLALHMTTGKGPDPHVFVIMLSHASMSL